MTAHDGEREIRDALEQSQMRERATREELHSALKTALDLQNQLAQAQRDLRGLESTVRELEKTASESAEVRDLLAAAMTVRFSPAPSEFKTSGVATAITVVGLLLFLAALFRGFH